MAPVQKLGNIDLKETDLPKVCIRFLHPVELSGRSDPIRDLRLHHHQRSSVISWDFLTKAPEEGMTKGGIFPAIVGTFYLIVGSSIISFPIGIMSGIYMNEYATNGKVVRFIRIMTNNLSGVPSVVIRFVRYVAVRQCTGLGRFDHSRFVYAGIDVASLIIRTTEEL